jgi:membrane protein DedA with SNARE-associated domain
VDDRPPDEPAPDGRADAERGEGPTEDHREPSSDTDRPRLSRIQLWAIVVPLICMVIAGYVADATWPKLVNSHPLLLMTLSSRNRNLALVATEVDAIPYYVVGTLRLLASDPLFYLLGYFYGDTVVAWVERRWTYAAEWVAWIERIFGKAAYPIIFIAPNNLFCALAGSTGMRPAVFIALNVSGTLTRLFLIRWLGDVFSKPLDWLRDFIGDYTGILLPITITIVVVMVVREFRRGSSELQQLVDLEDELEEIEDEG